MRVNYKKTLKIAVAIMLLPILVCWVGLTLTACSPDIKASEAMRIAKREFGCERILFIQTQALMLSREFVENGGAEAPRLRAHYIFYVVGEKDGQEIYIIIPSDPNIEKPFVTTWSFDHTFLQVVDKFNEHGANYVIEEPQGDVIRSYIRFESDVETVKSYAAYDAGCDDEMFYERLDIKGVFRYQWSDSENVYFCIVTQESGELKAYKCQTLLK